MTDVRNSVMDSFPFKPPRYPRKAQEAVIKAIHRAFEGGKRIVILESPVGSGKSAIAMTLAEHYGKSHVLTPRKSLQDQYYDDFRDNDMVVMKGRSSYPCTYEAGPSMYAQVTDKIKRGEIITTSGYMGNSCAEGPCLSKSNGPQIKKLCTNDDETPCPYNVAIEVASGADHIVHNLHGFIFQTHFAGRFQKRPLLIVDEAHEIEDIVRGFSSKKIKMGIQFSRYSTEPNLPDKDSPIDEWLDFFLEPRFLPRHEEDKERYIDSVETLRSMELDEYVLEIEEDDRAGTTKFGFYPISVGDKPAHLILQYGERVLLMSGTIYDKNYYCRQIGINPEEAHFLRVGSSFPKENRPIYMKRDYLIDTSHRFWSTNLSRLGIRVMKVLDVFSDVKGLIHVPSYRAAEELMDELRNPRLVSHTKEDFQTQLRRFYESDGNEVFVSPVCQQGVDFKDDRARFQIITRIPYLNTSDPFTEYKVKTDYSWYNYKALVVFGQQIGRVNRSADDFGVTVLMDERFVKFINSNRRKLPGWVTEAIIV